VRHRDCAVWCRPQKLWSAARCTPGEPDALKGARPGSEGVVGNVKERQRAGHLLHLSNRGWKTVIVEQFTMARSVDLLCEPIAKLP
jgi:hypothetical protein